MAFFNLIPIGQQREMTEVKQEREGMGSGKVSV